MGIESLPLRQVIKEPDLAEEWQEYRTSDLIARGALAIGDGYRAKNSELASTGIPFARVGNINGGFDFNDADLFPEADLAKVGEKVSRLGDVVFTSKGTVGRFAFVRQETPRFVYSPQLCYWRSLNPEVIDPKFLLYWMQSSEFWLQAEGVKGQTDMADYVSLGDQRRMFLTLPPIAEQHAIARILGALDDKIELNRRINRNLEAMAQAIFRSWFVDFEPVSAKREGRRPVGMDDATAALFPEHFQETEMGPIPAGWGQGRIGKEFNLTMGQSPPGHSYNENGDGPPFFQGRTDFCFRYPTRRIYCNAPTRFAESGDTLVSVRAPVGDVNMANERCCIGRGVAAVRHRGGFRSYTYYMMQSLGEDFAAFEGDGTLFGAINKDGFYNIKMAIPAQEVLSAFERIVSPIDQRIEVTEKQTLKLAALRDTLLPKLLSGELRVRV